MVDPTPKPNSQALMERAVVELRELRARVRQLERSAAEPIAIVGIGCRFPGGIHSPEEYWDLLVNGKEAIGEVPRDRWDVNQWYSSDRQEPGKIYCRYGGFLKEIEQFDPGFFGITPREANLLDPQQRLVLEVAWEALERASLPLAELQRKTTGVFIGASGWDFATLQMVGMDPAQMDPYFGTGSALSVIAGRLSFFLGLNGPSLVVDTACSSSLVSVHLACQSLRLGECDAALAGGVSLILRPEVTLNFCKAGMLSSDGHCKPFAEGANGYLRSEGCGIIVLKRFSDAVANGDNIVALIAGSAENHDGRSSGLTVPNGLSQQSVIRKALHQAGLSPERISYVEAHGTGTSLGDPIEAIALGEVFKSRPDKLRMGSVKANLGHLEGAAGIASLIKVALALHNKELPAQINCETPSSQIPWDKISVEVNQKKTSLQGAAGTSAAGVSSFGFSGTNAHVVLQAAPRRPDIAAKPGRSSFLFSARSEAALLQSAARYKEFLETRQENTFADICYSMARGRNVYKYRAAFVANSHDEAARILSNFILGAPYESLWCNVEGRENRRTPTVLEEHWAHDFVNQTNFDASKTFTIVGRQLVVLPTYPFERSRYWVQASLNIGEHPLLGRAIELPGSNELRFESEFHDQHPAFLSDHQFFGMVVVPAVVFVEMAMEAGRRAGVVPSLENIQIDQALVLTPLKRFRIQTVLKQIEEVYQFSIYSREASKVSASWKLHFSGSLNRSVALDSDSIPRNNAPLGQLRSVSEYYLNGKRRGIDLGPAFQSIKSLGKGIGGVRADLELPLVLREEAANYSIHPVLIDGCLQVLGSCFPEEHADSIFMPVGFKSFSLIPGIHQQIKVHATVEKQGSENRRLLGNALIFAMDGTLIGRIEGVSLQLASVDALKRSLSASKRVETRNSASGKPLRDYQNSATENQERLLGSVIQLELAGALRVDKSEIDIFTPLNLLGVDSLIAVELKNRLSTEFEVQVPLNWFMEDLGISEIATRLHQLLGQGEAACQQQDYQMVEGEL